MNLKAKILIGILIIGVILIGEWLVWNSQKTVHLIGELKYLEKVPLFVVNDQTVIPNPKAGIPFGTLANYSGKEVEIIGKKTSIEWGVRSPNCEMTQIGCPTKLEVILPEKIVILEDKYCEKDSDCVFTQCCGCARECNKKCNIKPEAVPCKCVDNQCVSGEFKTVTITTDKTEYDQGEKIKTIVKNSLDEDIYYPKYGESDCWKVPFGVEYFIQNEWQNIPVGRIDPTNPPYPVFCPQYMTLPSYHKLASGAMIEFSWGQQEINKGQVMPGKYRIKFGYVLKDKKQGKTIYSNEFTIKEKKEEIPLATKDVFVNHGNYRYIQKICNIC